MLQYFYKTTYESTAFQTAYKKKLFGFRFVRMGAESGGDGGDASPAVEKSAGDNHPRNYDISVTFFLTRIQLCNIFKIK